MSVTPAGMARTSLGLSFGRCYATAAAPTDSAKTKSRIFFMVFGYKG